jgi:hypothetical protein
VAAQVELTAVENVAEKAGTVSCRVGFSHAGFCSVHDMGFRYPRKVPATGNRPGFSLRRSARACLFHDRSTLLREPASLCTCVSPPACERGSGAWSHHCLNVEGLVPRSVYTALPSAGSGGSSLARRLPRPLPDRGRFFRPRVGPSPDTSSASQKSGVVSEVGEGVLVRFRVARPRRSGTRRCRSWPGAVRASVATGLEAFLLRAAGYVFGRMVAPILHVPSNRFAWYSFRRMRPILRAPNYAEFLGRMVAQGGVEPPTRGFSVRCSTN